MKKSKPTRAKPQVNQASKAKRRSKSKAQAKRTPKTQVTSVDEMASATNAARKARPGAKKPKLLSGGNPQIAKGDGDAPVQAYLAAMPGWKSDVGRRLDALVERNAPKVQKAVRWNSPFYGMQGKGWFLSFHCFTKYIKVSFFRGTSLIPMPPGGSKHPEVRYLDIREDDALDQVQLSKWIKQAAAMPGWIP